MAVGNYYDQGNVKTLLGIDQEDTIDDEKLDALGEACNNEMNNYLKTLTTNVPPSVISSDVAMATNYQVVSLYKAQKNDYEGAKYWQERYDTAKKSIMEKLTSNVSMANILVERFDGNATSESYETFFG